MLETSNAPLTVQNTHGILLRPEHNILQSSDALGWSSLYASRQLEQPYEDHYSSNQDHLIIIHLSGPVTIERVLSGDHAKAKVQAGGMFMLPAGRDFGVKLSGALETVHIYVKAAMLKMAAAELCKGDPDKIEFLPRLGEHDPFIEQLGRICCAMLADRQTDYFADGIARLASAQIARQHSNATLARECRVSGLSARQIAVVRDFVEDRLEEALTISDLSASIGLDPIHFARQFKRTTGKAPYQYVIEARVNRARALLATDMPIVEVALSAGFTHQEHLTRLFGRQVGMTPGAYRRSMMH
jgi:AraC family transcriptional regulator